MGTSKFAHRVCPPPAAQSPRSRVFDVRQTIVYAIAAFALSLNPLTGRAADVPDKTVVLTFDDAVKSQRTVVAPLLKDLGFDATLFVTRAFMDDTVHFMNWKDIAELYLMGFEIGNHSWTHGDFGSPEEGNGLGRELLLMETELAAVGVPKPISFAWCGNFFGPEGIAQLHAHGYKLARRGTWPEFPYGSKTPGVPLDVRVNSPLLIPTTLDFYPYSTLDDLQAALAMADDGKVVVLQFHGAPDIAHPWVSTSPNHLREFLSYMKRNGYRGIALRDVLKYYDPRSLPDDPLASRRYSMKDQERPGAYAPQMRALMREIERSR